MYRLAGSSKKKKNCIIKCTHMFVDWKRTDNDTTDNEVRLNVKICEMKTS